MNIFEFCNLFIQDYTLKKGMKQKMKKNKEKKIKTKQQKQFDKGQVFIKIMAGFLALLMILATSATLIYSLI